MSGLSERPLKLVLKVAGNEVTTGSPSLESVYDDSVDYDKHKDKKKKKKKKDEKHRASPPVSPVDKKKKVRNKYCVFVLYFFCVLANYILISVMSYRWPKKGRAQTLCIQTGMSRAELLLAPMFPRTSPSPPHLPKWKVELRTLSRFRTDLF